MNEERTTKVAYERLGDTFYEHRRDDVEFDLRWIRKLTPDLEAGGRVLDVGCGAGVPALPTLAETYEVHGVDIAVSQLRLAGENEPSASLTAGSSLRLPYRDGVFDGLLSLYLFFHVPFDRKEHVLREFRRVLGPEGSLVISMGAKRWTGAVDDWLGSGQRVEWYLDDEASNLRLLRRTGFEVQQCASVEDDIEDSIVHLFVKCDVAPEEESAKRSGVR